jgi:hypothetical protein
MTTPTMTSRMIQPSIMIGGVLDTGQPFGDH